MISRRKFLGSASAAAAYAAWGSNVSYATPLNLPLGIQLYSVRPDGTDEHQLTSGTGRHLCPNFSADGRWMAFCADTSGHFEIWTMKQNGTGPKQLTHFGGFAIFPDISPDGSKIAFGGTVGSDPKEQVYVIDAVTGGGLTKLTSRPAAALGCINNYSVWSPDGAGSPSFTRAGRKRQSDPRAGGS
jgi:Tol biopolymer transport system component